MPTPVAEGSKLPVVELVIPFPNQVPPGVMLDYVIGASDKHIELTGLMVASSEAETVI